MADRRLGDRSDVFFQRSLGSPRSTSLAPISQGR